MNVRHVWIDVEVVVTFRWEGWVASGVGKG